MSITDKINIDFQVIPTLDPRYITIADYSIWGHLENKTTIVEIIVPGEENPRVHYFKQRELNIINSYHLNLSCPDDCGDIELIDLPDGIYTITIKGSPDTFNMTRKYLRTTLTQLELDKMYINLDLLCDNIGFDLLNKLMDIDLLLKASEANVRYDNICKAQELLFRAQELIEKAKGCKSCVDV